MVCVALRGFLSRPGLQLTPLLIGICSFSISDTSHRKMPLLQQKQKPSAGGCLSVSLQSVQASLLRRLNSVQLEDVRFRLYWQALNKFRKMRTHKQIRGSSAFQVAAHGSLFSNNSSKCCPEVSRSLKEEVRSYFLPSLSFFFCLFLIDWTSQEGQIQRVPMEDCPEYCTRFVVLS